jgi:cytochrome c556
MKSPIFQDKPMKLLTKTSISLALSAALIATAGYAASQTASSSNAGVAARHAQMQMVAYKIGMLGAVAKGEVEFDAEMVNSAATNLKMLASMDTASLWLDGTAQGEVDGSRAKAEIWSDRAGFIGKFKQMEDAAAGLVDVASLEDLRAGMGPLGGSCKACHETYRGPKN